MIKKNLLNLGKTLLSCGVSLSVFTALQLPSNATVDITKENQNNSSDPSLHFNLSEEGADASSVLMARNIFQGKASWYGPKFHGRRTANGEIFNSGGLTAAHRYLPFGTRVRVTNMNNGKSVVVRINDRGPFIKGRIIDVSAGAARILRMMNSGVAPVKVEVIGR